MPGGHSVPAEVHIANLACIRLSELEKSGSTLFLTDAELRRYGLFKRPEARKQFLATHYLARTVVADALGTQPQQVQLAQRCPSCQSDAHGRPLPERGLSIAWSHTDEAVAVAVSSSEIGVDLEAIDSFGATSMGFEALLCTAAEIATLPTAPRDRRLALARLWTAKEALIKVGECSLDGMRRAQIGLGEPTGQTWRGRHRQWKLTQIELPGIMCTVASAEQVVVRVASPSGV